jgi:hypothetical protein
MMQFQCYVAPNEPQLNPWNVSLPLEASGSGLDKAHAGVQVGGTTNIYSPSFGYDLILQEFLKQAFRENLRSLRMKHTGMGVVSFGSCALLLAILCPPCLIFHSATYGLVEWLSVALGSELLTHLAVPRKSIRSAKRVANTISDLQILY